MTAPIQAMLEARSVALVGARTRRGFGFTLAVSSGQELVTTAADYARYALTLSGAWEALAADPNVGAVALAVDLVPEFDGDESYPRAVLAAAAATAKPVAVLAGLPAAIDQPAAARLRTAGVPVLEGTRTGLLAQRHLLDHAQPPPPPAPGPARTPPDGPLPGGGPELFALLREYGIPAVRTEAAASRAAAPAQAGAAYDDLAARLGPHVLVSQTAPAGPELALGLVRDPALGPLLVISAGGILIEILPNEWSCSPRSSVPWP